MASAVDADFAAIKLVQATDAAQQRSLAASGRTDDADNLRTADAEAKVVEHVKLPIA